MKIKLALSAILLAFAFGANASDDCMAIAKLNAPSGESATIHEIETLESLCDFGERMKEEGIGDIEMLSISRKMGAKVKMIFVKNGASLAYAKAMGAAGEVSIHQGYDIK